MNLITTVGAFAAAAFGRWIQFHPDKFFAIRGTFEGPHSSGAISFRKIVAMIGTFFVFFGVAGGVNSLFFWSDSNALHGIVMIVATIAGSFAMRHVRREVRVKYQPAAGQFGLWA